MSKLVVSDTKANVFICRTGTAGSAIPLPSLPNATEMTAWAAVGYELAVAGAPFLVHDDGDFWHETRRELTDGRGTVVGEFRDYNLPAWSGRDMTAPPRWEPSFATRRWQALRRG